MKDFFNYLVDWSCPHKRAFWFGLFFVDCPLLTLDYSMLFYWNHLLEIMAAIFPSGLGSAIQYGVGVTAIILTVERIKQARLVREQIRRSLEDDSEK